VDNDLENKLVEIKDHLGLPVKVLNVEHLRRIMSFRLEEIFQLIAQDLDQAGVRETVRAGVLLCGGAANIPRICELAESVLQMPVTTAKISSMDGLRASMDQPEFATAIGLVKYGSLQQRRRAVKNTLADGIRNAVGQWFKRD
jgi:cell division protein FtsA